MSIGSREYTPRVASQLISLTVLRCLRKTEMQYVSSDVWALVIPLSLSWR